jgi:ATP-binding cassette subfamily B multidrug efflux pump
VDERGDQTGAIAATMGLVFRLNQMSGWMMFNINGLIRAYSTVQDATETISVEPAIRDKPDAVDMPRSSGHIRFDECRVSTTARNHGELFNGLTVEIKPGEKVGLVGPVGRRQVDFRQPAAAAVRRGGRADSLDGHDIRDVTQASLRDQFGVVSQEPSLMHRSLRDNIAYGRPEATRRRSPRRRKRRMRMTSSRRRGSRRAGAATTRMSANAASSCPAASASVWPSRV